ncbi:MAG: 16S rRNA (cytosine(1402)-N(4))-methyltransferase RsmH [Patescibacteria group bacterium]
MSVHKSVLLKESIESLNLKSGDIVVDATLGGGGHSEAILEKIGETGILIAIDADSNAIEKFKSKVKSQKSKVWGKIFLVNDNFANLDNILSDLRIDKVDAILADFGISSDQLDSKERGFSFQKDAPLDMRMNQDEKITAEKIVNNYSEEELSRIFKEYAEERYAKSIAKNIAKQRKTKPIKTTLELVSIIENSVPERYKHQRISPATRVFQALRIEVNKELENIREFIPKAIEVLDKKGRLAAITFHSGEDRIAKEIFRGNARGCICPPSFPICRCGNKPRIKIIAKKPILPSESEIETNPRSRSAKLRVIEKI